MEIGLYPKYFIRRLFAHGKHSFFSDGYKCMYPVEFSRHGMTPWQHYVIDGHRKGYDNGNHPSNDLFFSEGYETEYQDIKDAGVDAWHHYAEQGYVEGRDNGLHPDEKIFFAKGYLEMYPDVARSKVDPWRHYVLHGKAEHRDNGLHPGEKTFFAKGYLEMYPDVAKANINPWRHYVLYGKREGRDNGLHPSFRGFFPEGYKYNYPSCTLEPYGSDLWMNYIKIGRTLGRNNGLSPILPFFNGAYLERYPERTIEQAWKDYVLNLIRSPYEDLNLYPAGSGIRELLKKRHPSVAVIMPVYNRKKLVMKAITSVQQQSWTNWHLYVVDDFSNDGTYEYLKAIISDPRITLLKSINKGVCEARNTGIAKIKSEDYVAYLDSDNTWNREYLELMLCRLLETNTYCCYGVLKRFKRQKDGSSRVTGFLYEPFDFYKLRMSNYIDLNVFMHSASVLKEMGGFDTSLRRVVDWEWILRLAERYSFSRLPYVSCNYDDTEDQNRITKKDSFTFNYVNVVRNKHWFDWKFLTESSVKNDKNLVSVIIYYGRNDSLLFLKNCLNSLKISRLYSHTKYRTEIILVDDSVNVAGHNAVLSYYDNALIDKYLINTRELYFPLSCNRALGISNGAYVVFLNLHSYVSINWLDPLIDPMKKHIELKGTTAKVLLPDGVINCSGDSFDSVSGFPYDNLHGLQSDFQSAKRFTLVPCVGSYCCAFRTSDVISKNGLYCLFYESRLTIADLCRQLSNGEALFAFIPDSIVICPSDTPQAELECKDLEPFAERWHGKGCYDEHKYIARRNLCKVIENLDKICSVSFKKYSDISITEVSTDYFVPKFDYSKFWNDCEVSSKQQVALQKIQSLAKLVVIKDPSPATPYDKKYAWGDYYFAKSLAKYFQRLGFITRIDHNGEWYSHNDAFCINIVLRGLTKFDCSRYPNSINLMWLMYNSDEINDTEINEYDCIFATSELLTEKYNHSPSLHVPVLYLPQCTDPDIFKLGTVSEAYSSGNLFLGNSRYMFRDVVKMCIDEGVDIEIIGNAWSSFVDKKFIRSEAVPNILVPMFYRGADTVLNDHREDMKQSGIVSNRIFDVLACGRGIVTDNFQNIPNELKFACFSYENCNIKEAIDKCRKFNQNLTKEQKQRLHDIVCEKHSFSRRVLQITDALYSIIERRQKNSHEK